jgi:hypothetical protein
MTREKASRVSSDAKMRRLLLLLPLFFLFPEFSAAPTSARSVAGIEVPETLDNGGVLLTLNGAGTRTNYFLDVYVGGLYLKERSTDAGKPCPGAKDS